MEIKNIDLTEIVFRSRNKAYGAYDLRRTYVKNTRNAMIICIILAFVVIFLPLGVTALKGLFVSDEVVEVVEVEETVATLEEPPPMDETEPPPEIPPVEAPPPPKRSTVKFVEPEPVKDEEEPEEPEEIKDVKEIMEANVDLGAATVEGDEDAPPDFTGIGVVGGTGDAPAEVKEPVKKETAPDPNAFIMAEEQPKPVNLANIQRAINYPQLLKEQGIEGRVMFRILVNERGDYVKHIVNRSPHKLMTQEAEKHLNKLKFTPAIQAGKPIKFWVNVPIVFKLN